MKLKFGILTFSFIRCLGGPRKWRSHLSQLNFPVFETGPKRKADVADLFKKYNNSRMENCKNKKCDYASSEREQITFIKIFIWGLFSSFKTRKLRKCSKKFARWHDHEFDFFFRFFFHIEIEVHAFLNHNGCKKGWEKWRSHRDLNSDRWIQSPEC